MQTQFDDAAFRGTAPVEADELDLDAVRQFVLEECGVNLGEVTASRFRGGQSNPSYLLRTSGGEYVLRSKPKGQLEKTAHAIDREYRVISALADTQVPVPRPLAYCADPAVIGSEFYLMVFVPGRVFWNPALPELVPDERGIVCSQSNEVLAALHSLDPEQVGLSDLGKPSGYLQRQFNGWTRQYLALVDQPSADMALSIEWLSEVIPALPDETSLVHGDFRIDNLIFQSSGDSLRVDAVLDWELATLGNPLLDLSNQCAQWRLPAEVYGGLGNHDREGHGLPTEHEHMAEYCTLTGRAEIPSWETYVAYSLYRFACVLEAVAGRHRRGTAVSALALDMSRHAPTVAHEASSLIRSLQAA